MSNICQILREVPVSTSSSVFLEDGDSLSFHLSQVQLFATALGSILEVHGIRREDRLAIVLPDGARLCIAFLGVSCHCIAAPLNPAASLPDLLSWLEDLQPRALLICEGSPAVAHKAASRLGLTVIDLEAVASRIGKPDSEKTERLNLNLATLCR